jgi:hypothetical protein
MSDFDALAQRLGADLGAEVRKLVGELAADLTARIDASTVRSTFIDREGALVLAYGDGSTRALGPVIGPAGPAGQPPDVSGLESRLSAIEGRSVTSALIDRDGCLILTLGGGGTLSAGKVAGRDGADGKNGADGKDGSAGEPGLGFDDLACSLAADGRTLVIRFARGAQEASFEIPLPAMVYRGVFEPGRVYQPGDTVTFGGSVWVCGAVSSERPGAGDAWTLAVKRGRDGKDTARLAEAR